MGNMVRRPRTAIAPSSDWLATIPPSPVPTGKPRKLNDIETAKARPIQAGSVRRWRVVNIAMSIGPRNHKCRASH